jgi:hypothetical protein
MGIIQMFKLSVKIFLPDNLVVVGSPVGVPLLRVVDGTKEGIKLVEDVVEGPEISNVNISFIFEEENNIYNCLQVTGLLCIYISNQVTKCGYKCTQICLEIKTCRTKYSHKISSL